MLPSQPYKKDFEGIFEEKQAFFNAVFDQNFQNATTFTEQIGILCSYLRNENIMVSFERIAAVFGKTRQCVCYHLQCYNNHNDTIGRPPLLTDEELQLVIEEINHHIYNDIGPFYPTYEDISDFIYFKFGKSIIPDTLRHILRDNFGDYIKTVTGKAMEENRLNININDLENNLKDLKNKIDGIPCPFVFNIDEVGVQEYADNEEKKVIVPASYPFKTAPYGISRKEKHSSCLTCISMNGMFTIPQIAVRRATVDSQLYQKIPYTSAQIVHTAKGYINSQSFKYYFETIFIPKLEELRKELNYDGNAIIILDGYTAHKNLIHTLNYSDKKIIFHFLIPHSTDQTQPLDIGIFAQMKRFSSNFRKNTSFSTQSNQIARIVENIEQACSSPACQSAFKAAGIIPELVQCEDGSFIQIAQFDFTKCQKVRFYQINYIQDLVEKNYPLSEVQQMIYQNYISDANINHESTDESFRIGIPYFENNR